MHVHSAAKPHKLVSGVMEPGLMGFYQHVDGRILDESPYAFMGNSAEAKCLEDVMVAKGKQSLGSNRGAVQAKLC
jgi:hypothetical protein